MQQKSSGGGKKRGINTWVVWKVVVSSCIQVTPLHCFHRAAGSVDSDTKSLHRRRSPEWLGWVWATNFLLADWRRRRKCFLNLLFPVPIWWKANRKCLNRGGPFREKKMEADWTNLLTITFKLNRFDFSLPVEPVCNSLRLPTGARGNTGRVATTFVYKLAAASFSSSSSAFFKGSLAASCFCYNKKDADWFLKTGRRCLQLELFKMDGWDFRFEISPTNHATSTGITAMVSASYVAKLCPSAFVINFSEQSGMKKFVRYSLLLSFFFF